MHQPASCTTTCRCIGLKAIRAMHLQMPSATYTLGLFPLLFFIFLLYHSLFFLFNFLTLCFPLFIYLFICSKFFAFSDLHWFRVGFFYWCMKEIALTL